MRLSIHLMFWTGTDNVDTEIIYLKEIPSKGMRCQWDTFLKLQDTKWQTLTSVTEQVHVVSQLEKVIPTLSIPRASKEPWGWDRSGWGDITPWTSKYATQLLNLKVQCGAPHFHGVHFWNVPKMCLCLWGWPAVYYKKDWSVLTPRMKGMPSRSHTLQGTTFKETVGPRLERFSKTMSKIVPPPKK